MRSPPEEIGILPQGCAWHTCHIRRPSTSSTSAPSHLLKRGKPRNCGGITTRPNLCRAGNFQAAKWGVFRRRCHFGRSSLEPAAPFDRAEDAEWCLFRTPNTQHLSPTRSVVTHDVFRPATSILEETGSWFLTISGNARCVPACNSGTWGRHSVRGCPGLRRGRRLLFPCSRAQRS